MTTKRVAFGPSPMVAPSINCFDQILVVTVTSLRLIGIPLNPSSIKSYIFRYWSISFGLILLLLNLVTNVAIFVKKLQNIRLKKIMTTRDWNVLINEINLAATLVILHANLLIRTAPNWKEFESILRQINRLKMFEDGDYEKFRRIIVKGIVVAIAMVNFHDS